MSPKDFEEGGRFQVGRVVNAKSASYEGRRTEPPSRYTQSDLIDAMMSAYRFATTDVDRRLLRDIAGLGTSRTRESIITGLVDRGFLAEHKAKRSRARVELKPSDAAMTIIESLPRMLTDPATTAKWELAFQKIESGQATPAQLRVYFESFMAQIVAHAKGLGQISIAPIGSKPASGAKHFAKPAPQSAAKKH